MLHREVFKLNETNENGNVWLMLRDLDCPPVAILEIYVCQARQAVAAGLSGEQLERLGDACIQASNVMKDAEREYAKKMEVTGGGS